MKTILLVTWLVCSQSPSSYQVEFDTSAKCTQAKDALLSDYQRLYGPPSQKPQRRYICQPSSPSCHDSRRARLCASYRISGVRRALNLLHPN